MKSKLVAKKVLITILVMFETIIMLSGAVSNVKANNEIKPTVAFKNPKVDNCNCAYNDPFCEHNYDIYTDGIPISFMGYGIVTRLEYDVAAGSYGSDYIQNWNDLYKRSAISDSINPYSEYFHVNVPSVMENYGVRSLDEGTGGLKVFTDFYYRENNSLQVVYRVFNQSDTAKSFRLATAIDLCFYNNDFATCELIKSDSGAARGFILSDDDVAVTNHTGTGKQLYFMLRDSKWVTDVDTLWLGNWRESPTAYKNNMFKSNEVDLNQVDSCVAFSWKNRVLAAGESVELSYLIGYADEDMYDIVYDANGGTFAHGNNTDTIRYVRNKTYNYRDSSDLYSSNAELVFKGWSTDRNAISGYTSADTFNNAAPENGQLVLYAIWQPNKVHQTVNVRFEDQNGAFGEYITVINDDYNIGDRVYWHRPADDVYQATTVDYTVSAAYTEYVTVYRKQFSVGLTKGTGISAVSGAANYRVGQSVTIDATVSTGYTWKDWTGTFTETTKNYTFTMPSSNVTLTAYAHDITAPTITLSQSPTAWTNGNVTLTATASDNGSGLHSSGAYKWNSGSYGISTTYIATTNGTYTVTVRDNDGNTATASITVTNIDKINPAFNIGAVKSGTTASITSGTWYNTNITVNATSIDDGAATTSYGKSGLHSSYIKWDTSGSYGSFGTSTSQTITVVDGSTYNRTVKATVRDAVGNYVEKTFTVKIDKAKPLVTLSQSPTAWTNGNVTLTATASDNGSGLHATPYSWDNGSTWTATKTKTVSVNGTYSVKVRDTAGNIASASITVTNIDKLLPSLSLSAKANGTAINSDAWSKYDVIVTETHSDQAATADYGQSNFNTNYIKWANPTYGSYGSSTSVTVSTSNGTVLERNVQATVQDKAGNDASASFYIKIDKQAPSIALSQNPTAWTNGDVTLSVTANDGSGIGLNPKPYKWFSDTAFNTTTQVTVAKNGTYSIQVQDKLGNTATASIKVTNIDKLSPNIIGLEAFATISEIDRNEGKQTVTVTLTDPSNTDYGASGVKGGTLTVTNSDNNLSKTWTISDTGIIEIDITNKEYSELFYGNFKVTVEAEDNVGNKSTKAFDITEFTLDTELIHADNYKSSLFIKGETGLFIFYAGGYPDEVRVYFPLDAGLDQDYSATFYYTKQKAVEIGQIPFYVPLDAIEGDYTIYVESYKNGKPLQTKSQAFQITEETILDRLQTQLSR